MKGFVLWRTCHREYVNGRVNVIQHDPRNKKPEHFLGKQGAVFVYLTDKDALAAKRILFQSRDYEVVEIDLLVRS